MKFLMCALFFLCSPHAFTQSETNCDFTPGIYDSNVLALSWQPGFCQTYGYEAGKPECLHLAQKSYAAQHLVLHGLWPNQKACGQSYGYCGVVPQGYHCNYPEVPLSTKVATALHELMPSFHFGSCLERHEWNKHGSCQNLNADAYFTLAMRLAREVDESPFGVFLTRNRGKNVSLTALHQAIVDTVGVDYAKTFYLGCKNSTLVDVYIELPAIIDEDEPLLSLIKRGPNYPRRDSCPRNVKISNFSREMNLSMF
ncbi:MAG: ribonuclease T [Legionella sp. 40-6]|nr:ribonuclease T [Legionella sp.]OJY39265.1 MAG: ribonuclease T [Legionella sp. 40-6]